MTSRDGRRPSPSSARTVRRSGRSTCKEVDTYQGDDKKTKRGEEAAPDENIGLPSLLAGVNIIMSKNLLGRAFGWNSTTFDLLSGQGERARV